MADEYDDLVGVWNLVSVAAFSSGAHDEHPFGAAPRGLLVYTRNRKMTAVISYSDRPPLSADRVSAPVDERAEAFSTFFAYAGSYSIEADVVRHHVEVASVENWVGTDLVRMMKRDGEQMILRTPPLVVDGEDRVTELVWHRVDDDTRLP